MKNGNAVVSIVFKVLGRFLKASLIYRGQFLNLVHFIEPGQLLLLKGDWCSPLIL
jgi:hypothetical protein